MMSIKSRWVPHTITVMRVYDLLEKRVNEVVWWCGVVWGVGWCDAVGETELMREWGTREGKGTKRGMMAIISPRADFCAQTH